VSLANVRSVGTARSGPKAKVEVVIGQTPGGHSGCELRITTHKLREFRLWLGRGHPLRTLRDLLDRAIAELDAETPPASCTETHETAPPSAQAPHRRARVVDPPRRGLPPKSFVEAMAATASDAPTGPITTEEER
jgi:hypothetical protein